jgi:hypothetical protein
MRNEFRFELAFQANAIIKETFSAIILHLCPDSRRGASMDCPGLEFSYLFASTCMMLHLHWPNTCLLQFYPALTFRGTGQSKQTSQTT